MTDSSAASTKRPGPVILAALAVALAGAIVYTMWPSRPAASPSNPPREQRKQADAKNAPDAPGSLQVRLDALTQAPPAPDDETARNPFRFYVKPPPPPPPPPRVPKPGESDYVAPPPPPPAPPPGPPPITLKFIGTLEVKGRKVAIFSDNRGIPMYASEGEVVMGQYRVVKIGVESVTLEYLDGRGRQIIPMRG